MTGTGRMLPYGGGISGHSGDPACQRRQSRRYLSYARTTPNGSTGLGLFDVCPTREEMGASQAPTGRR